MTDLIMIHRPPHYQGTKYEVIEVIKGLGLTEDYAFGNAIKYLLRYHKKGNGAVDVMKAGWYINYLIENMGRRASHDPKFPEALHEVVATFEIPDKAISRAVYSVLLAAWLGSVPELQNAKICLNAWLEARGEPRI